MFGLNEELPISRRRREVVLILSLIVINRQTEDLIQLSTFYTQIKQR